MSNDDPQKHDWAEYVGAEVAAGRCPYSGATINDCQTSDMCDCFDFPDDRCNPPLRWHVIPHRGCMLR